MLLNWVCFIFFKISGFFFFNEIKLYEILRIENIDTECWFGYKNRKLFFCLFFKYKLFYYFWNKLRFFKIILFF